MTKQLSRCCKAEIELTGEDRPNHFKCNDCGRIIGEPYEIKHITRSDIPDDKTGMIINVLIDAVNLLQEYNKDHHERIHELEKLAKIAESSLAQKSEQIKELQSYSKIESSGPQTTEESIPVPEEVCFLKMGISKEMSLYFDKKSLSYSQGCDDWLVGSFNSESATKLRLPCELVPCKVKDIKIGERFINEYHSPDIVRNYRLKIANNVCISAGPGINVYQLEESDETVYKVTAID